MTEVVDGDGGSAFAFVVPVRLGWEGNLASITLSGPDGSATLDRDSDLPMAIVRDARTGQVVGIFRDPPPSVMAAVAGDAVAGRSSEVRVLFSRGLPWN